MQRHQNIAKIKQLTTDLWNKSTRYEKKTLFLSYVFRIAYDFTLTEQRSWIHMLEKQLAEKTDGKEIVTSE